MVVFLVMLQIALLIAANVAFAKSFVYYYGLSLVFSLVVLVAIVNSKGNAAFKIAWIVPVLVIPMFGALFYLYCTNQISVAAIKKRLAASTEQLKEMLPDGILPDAPEYNGNMGEVGLSQYLVRTGAYPAYTNTEVTYYPSGECCFEDMKQELRKAQHFIFIEFFIIAKGEMWGEILEILKEKVKEGVEVRVMYDGMCSFLLLPYSYPKQLEQYGIRCRMFSPIRPVISTYQNNRDHRKIMDIDGRTAFTGGVNLADEYINKRERFGYWKDSAVRLTGSAVSSMTMMFLELWNVADSVPEDFGKYLSTVPQDIYAKGVVIPYGDGPYNNEEIGQRVYIDMLNRAQRYVHIMTPYLVPDDELLGALEFAAKRGVEVIIMMPHIPDKKYPYLLARTYYRQLLTSGVYIYEFTPGFVHAKQFVSDDIRAAVGSFNLDYRSMYLHYECAAYLYDVPAVRDIEKDFQETLAKCQQITVETCNRYTKASAIVGSVMRLFAPLI